MKEVPNKNNPWTKQSNPDFFPQLTFAPSDDENAILFNTLFRLLRLIAPITALFRPVTSWLSSKAAISKNITLVSMHQGQKTRCISPHVQYC